MPADPSTVAGVTLAAHLLVEAGSALSRAGDLLEFSGWSDEPEAVRAALALATRKVFAVRELVDGHLRAIRSNGDPRHPDEELRRALELLAIAKEELLAP